MRDNGFAGRATRDLWSEGHQKGGLHCHRGDLFVLGVHHQLLPSKQSEKAIREIINFVFIIILE